jgi:hypothetical protein
MRTQAIWFAKNCAVPHRRHGGDARRRAIDAGPGHRREIRRPLGYAMVGGLLVSQALTLFTTLSQWLNRGSRSAQKASDRVPEGRAENALKPQPLVAE